ncbi:MAG: radical SAM family heme chaperone HemW [Ruminococcaceae bacterium]|nr:radical SAM family heme chaperone HemW [Oscillospiraceae bacterium]
MEKAGLYFHIPFCKNKCPYCDFYSVKYCESAARDYCILLCDEIKKYSGEFDTVYFGGGTPSIIPSELIKMLLDKSKSQFDIAEDSEITVECNPREDLKSAFEVYRSCGVNRLSIGMQSAVDKERFALGRAAGKAEVEATVTAAKNAGFNNISLDLMLGTPYQTIESLDKTFDFIDKMNVQHISAYMLSIEEGTRFFEIKEKLALPQEDEVSEMYLKTISILRELGFEQYEISNFAKPGFESRHNNKYWQLDEYLGIGKTAHSFWGGRRFYYDENMWIVDDGEGGDLNEKIMLGLRLTKGVEKSIITKPFEHLINAGLLTDKGDRVALTPSGMLVSNSVINELI